MSDKRSVSTDALATLGTIIESGGRDAIHLAVEPVIAGEPLRAGQDIGLVDGKAYVVTRYTTNIKALGIVDPFLLQNVREGEKFWLIVYPRQITSLRHVWSHPDFEDDKPLMIVKDKKESEAWLRNWCDSINDISYEDLIAVMSGVGEVSKSEGYGQRWTNEGDYLLSHGFDNDTYEIPLEVWVHVENVIGRKLDSYPSHFSCTC